MVMNIDKDYCEWQKQKAELQNLLDTHNYNEIFFRRKYILKSKKQMKKYLEFK